MGFAILIHAFSFTFKTQDNIVFGTVATIQPMRSHISQLIKSLETVGKNDSLGVKWLPEHDRDIFDPRN